MSTLSDTPGYLPLEQYDQRFKDQTRKHRGIKRERRQQKASRHRAGQRRQLMIWSFETVCSATFVAAFVAIVAVLSAFEHKPIPQWRYGLTLNTMISIFVVVLKASMLSVASQCLSHLKWLCFRAKHQLLDFANYDRASRGPLGSLQLLWKLRTRDVIASLGAFITVAALLIDPFAQQVIGSYGCVVELKDASATLNRANSYIKVYYGGASGNTADLPMQKAINAGLYNPGSVPPFVCPTGNCTFSIPYHTLGYCSQCTDLSSQLVTSYQNTSRKISNSTWLGENYTISLPPLSKGYEPSAVAWIANSNASLFSVTRGGSIVAAFTTNTTDLALNTTDMGVSQPGVWRGTLGAHCSFAPCIRTCTAIVKNFALEEKVLTSILLGEGTTDETGDGLRVDRECVTRLSEQQRDSLGIRQVPGTDWSVIGNASFTANGSYYFINNGSYYSPDPAMLPSHCVYGVNYQAISTLVNFLGNFLTGDVRTSDLNLWHAYGPAPIVAIYNMSRMSFDSINATWRNISDSITTQIRIDNGRGYYYGVGVPSDPVRGRTWEDRVCVRVRWAFLAYPAVVLVLATAFFIATVSRGKGTVGEDWKSSELALLFHGLPEDTLEKYDRVHELATVQDMEAVAKTMLVSLSPEDTRLRADGR